MSRRNLTTNPPGPPAVTYGANGNVYWQDPGELVFAMALAYPYLDTTLQAQVRAHMASEMADFPPLQNWRNSARGPVCCVSRGRPPALGPIRNRC